MYSNWTLSVLYAYFRSKNSGSFGFAGPPADSTRAPRSAAAPSPNALRKQRTHTAHRCERAAGRGVGHAIRGGASQSAGRSSDYLKARKARFSAGVWSVCHAAQQPPAPVLCCAQAPARHTAVSAVLGGEWVMRSGGAHRRARAAPRVIVTPTMGGREPAVAIMLLRPRSPNATLNISDQGAGWSTLSRRAVAQGEACLCHVAHALSTPTTTRHRSRCAPASTLIAARLNTELQRDHL